MSETQKSSPIFMHFKSAQSVGVGDLGSALPSPPSFVSSLVDLVSSPGIKTFDSYSFERSIMTPASPFRFTAPGIDKDLRTSIRSGDLVQMFVTNSDGVNLPLATGIIDETDTHVMPGKVEYVLTGRDLLGQLVDNAAVDAQNRVIQTKKVTLANIANLLVKNTRVPQQVITQQIPNSSLLFQTNPGETKINALQRYLEFTNCLVWSKPNGQMVVGKPNFVQSPAGFLRLAASPTFGNNVLDARVRRNTNTAIRQIVVQLQSLVQADAGAFTQLNQDQDVLQISNSGGGRSVFDVFTYGQGESAVNFIVHVANMPGAANQLGQGKALREIARDNMKVIEVELTVKGHVNDQGDLYDIDQTYFVDIPDDKVSEMMYVYSVHHELTLEHGMISKLKLVRMGTIVANTFQLPEISF